MGHDVTLFAPAGSITSATLVDTVRAPLDSSSADPRLEEELHIAMAMEAAGDGSFDIVHSHLHVHGLVFSRMIPTPVVTTLHGVAWDPATHPLLLRYADMPFVSLSDSERSFLPELSYVATIPNGIRTGEIRVGPGTGGYLAFAGRMSPEKGPDLAIEAALNAGVPLRLAGVVEDRHREFFEQTMRRARSRTSSTSDPSTVRSCGICLVTRAPWSCLSDGIEPFGLVVVESLAAGTPVIAWRMGAMPEILEDTVTGFLVDDVAAAVQSIRRIGEIERASCRMVAEARFSDTAMARAYAELYARLAATTSSPKRGR